MDSLSTQLFCSIWRFGTCAATVLESLQMEVEYYIHMPFLDLVQSARRRCIDFYNKPCIELKPEYVIQLLIKMYRPTHNHI